MKQTLAIVGQSGVGKGTIIKALLQRHPSLSLVVSFTTRPIRPKEQHGIHYYFVTQNQFTRLHAQGEMIEVQKVFGNWYGTSRTHFQGLTRNGQRPVLDVEAQGLISMGNYLAEVQQTMLDNNIIQRQPCPMQKLMYVICRWLDHDTSSLSSNQISKNIKDEMGQLGFNYETVESNERQREELLAVRNRLVREKEMLERQRRQVERERDESLRRVGAFRRAPRNQNGNEDQISHDSMETDGQGTNAHPNSIYHRRYNFNSTTNEIGTTTADINEEEHTHSGGLESESRSNVVEGQQLNTHSEGSHHRGTTRHAPLRHSSLQTANSEGDPTGEDQNSSNSNNGLLPPPVPSNIPEQLYMNSLEYHRLQLERARILQQRNQLYAKMEKIAQLQRLQRQYQEELHRMEAERRGYEERLGTVMEETRAQPLQDAPHTSIQGGSADIEETMQFRRREEEEEKRREDEDKEEMEGPKKE